MKLVKILIPFTDALTGKVHVPNEEAEFTEERIADIKKVNANMVLVLGDAKKPVAEVKTEAKAEASEPKPKKSKAKN